MASHKILMVSSEAGPYARTGGLGDVLGALPGDLARQGHEIKVVVPGYGTIDRKQFGISRHGRPFAVKIDGNVVSTMLERAEPAKSGAEYLFVDNQAFFGRPEFYVDPKTGEDYVDNDLRFAFFARATLEAMKAIDWRPDVIHAHDWQAALVVVLLKSVYKDDPFFADCKTVFTIHNLGYQGLFEEKRYKKLGLPEELMYAMTGALEFYEKSNFLKGGLILADKITTVSERYAEEIQSDDEFGCGLEGVLADRSEDLIGIVNGVDYALWSPQKDKKIPSKFNLSNLSGKRTCKVELMGKAGLPIRDKVPLVGMVTRLTSQKGVDLLVEAAEEVFDMDLQMIILGNGDEEYHEALKQLEVEYPDRLKVYLEFNDELAHSIVAGSDIYLMPSKYEPCGLNQLYALKYGTVPVVRKVGGLADTVVDYDADTGTGTGFVFEEYTAEAFVEGLKRAVELFKRRQLWVKLLKAGMRQDYSWKSSASKYSALYDSLIEG